MNKLTNQIQEIVGKNEDILGMIDYLEKNNPEINILDFIIQEYEFHHSNSQTGMIHGVRWHKGMTCEEWEKVFDETKIILEKLQLLKNEKIHE